MTNPWDIDKAFEPMFTDTIGYSASRQQNIAHNTSFRACVYPAYDAEPFADIDAATEVKIRDIMISKSGKDGWCLNENPQIGDIITLEDNSKWSVSKVQSTQGWFNIQTRSI